MILLKASGEKKKTRNPMWERDYGFSTHRSAFNKSASDGKSNLLLQFFPFKTDGDQKVHFIIMAY